jgi:hypothetical protein
VTLSALQLLAAAQQIPPKHFLAWAMKFNSLMEYQPMLTENQHAQN